jgi:hypothetical protein
VITTTTGLSPRPRTSFPKPGMEACSARAGGIVAGVALLLRAGRLVSCQTGSTYEAARSWEGAGSHGGTPVRGAAQPL